jgi:hypothetical protein
MQLKTILYVTSQKEANVNIATIAAEGVFTITLLEMKGITRCKLTIISESAVCKKFLG